MKKLWLIIMLATAATQAHAQKCAGEILLQQKLNSDPALAATYKHQQEQLNQEAKLRGIASARNSGQITIPVVFHVLLNQSQFNLMNGKTGVDERIVSQLAALNRDFNAANQDISKVPNGFKPFIGNMQLVFRLAHRDEQGKSTSGVEYKILNNSIDGFHAGGGLEKDATQNGLAAWDVEHYLNIWVVNITGFGGGILGFTVSPTTEVLFNQKRGTTLAYGALGQNYGAQGTFITDADSGRTLVHELGHFFELAHIWGLTDNCSDDDGVDDTPLQQTFTPGCPTTFPMTDNCTTGGDGIMYMNYMDYTMDKCLLFFTKGQVDKANASLDGGNKTLSESGDRADWPNYIAGLSADNNFKIYPNPTSGIFTLESNNSLQHIDILNAMGQVVLQIDNINSKQQNIDLSGKAKGIYTLRCRYAEGTVTRKIIVQ